MRKPKLLPPQKATVSNWMQKKQGVLINLVDRSCRYRDAYVKWCDRLSQPNSTATITTYNTRLELTPSGKIRVEEHQKVGTVVIPEINDLLPLEGIIFEPQAPPDIERHYLYPKDEDAALLPPKIIKPLQLSLPTSDSEIKLHLASQESGDRRVHSLEELLKGYGEVFSIYWERVTMPKPLIFLINSYQCNIEEWEFFLGMSLVRPPHSILRLIEDIPQMRSSPHFPQFKEPVAIDFQQSQPQLITQKVMK